jgi:Spy/CpxP family protein refolding chaperone
MTRFFRFFVPATLLLTLGAFAPAALAQGHMGPPPGGPDGHGGPGGPGGPGEMGHYMMLLHNLNLTTAQQDQVHSLMEAQRTQMGPLFEDLRTGHESLNAKLYATGSTPSLSDLTAEASQLSQIHAQIDLSELQTVLKIRALLTSTQLSQLSSLHSQLESLRQQTDALLKPSASNTTP